jgi:hypothetical protein
LLPLFGKQLKTVIREIAESIPGEEGLIQGNLGGPPFCQNIRALESFYEGELRSAPPSYGTSAETVLKPSRDT